MRKWIPWLPLVMFGSLVYWTVALNFGLLSLLGLSSYVSLSTEVGLGTDDFYVDKDSFQPITVHLTGQDDLGLRASDSDSLLVDVISDRDTTRLDLGGAGDRSGRVDQGPGDTAF